MLSAKCPKTSCQKGKLHTKDDLENHSKVIPLGAMVENHPISVRDQSRLHQFGKEVLLGDFLGMN